MTKRKEEREFLQTSLKVMRTFMTAFLAIEHSFSKMMEDSLVMGVTME
jgi:hypothetical protein